MKLILSLSALLVGLGAGAGGAYFMKSPAAAAAPPPVEEQSEGEADFAPLPSQFVIPLTEEGRVRGMVAVNLAVRLLPDKIDTFEDQEPRLRDVYIDVLFRHASSGGFDGDFTSGQAMVDLRSALDRATRERLGDIADRVLITNLARQDY